MIDIKLIREDPEIVRKNLKNKFQEEKIPLVEEARRLDGLWRSLKMQGDALRRSRNEVSKKINELKKKGQDASAALEEAKAIPKKIAALEEQERDMEEQIRDVLSKIPNIIHPMVPIGKDDSENVERERIGEPPKFEFKPKNHIELGEQLGVLDFDLSAEASGKGFYYLKGELAILNQALIRFATDRMIEKGFTYVETPLMLRSKVINNVTDLNDQKNQIYKIEGEDLYLIGTSEHSLIGRFIDTIIKEDDLPIKNTSYSMCFRKEIGAHGIEEKGLYRTHQFNKVEMIVICQPSNSEKYFEELKKITVEILKDLKIPCRVLEMCSGDLGELKSRQVDIEAWSPIKKEYYEVGSCSNLTDAQARKLKIRVQTRKGDKYVPHTLNNTAVATSRVLVALMENHQKADGSIRIPAALQSYTGFKEIKAKKK